MLTTNLHSTHPKKIAESVNDNRITFPMDYLSDVRYMLQFRALSKKNSKTRLENDHLPPK